MNRIYLLAAILVLLGKQSFAQRLEDIYSASFYGDYDDLILKLNKDLAQYRSTHVKSVSFRDIDWNDQVHLFFDKEGRLVKRQQETCTGHFYYENDKIKKIIVNDTSANKLICQWDLSYAQNEINKINVKGRFGNYDLTFFYGKKFGNLREKMILRKEQEKGRKDTFLISFKKMTGEIVVSTKYDGELLNEKKYIDTTLISEVIYGKDKSKQNTHEVSVSYYNKIGEKYVVRTGCREFYGVHDCSTLIDCYKDGRVIWTKEISVNNDTPIEAIRKWESQYDTNGLIKSEICYEGGEGEKKRISYQINYEYEFW